MLLPLLIQNLSVAVVIPPTGIAPGPWYVYPPLTYVNGNRGKNNQLSSFAWTRGRRWRRYDK